VRFIIRPNKPLTSLYVLTQSIIVLWILMQKPLQVLLCSLIALLTNNTNRNYTTFFSKPLKVVALKCACGNKILHYHCLWQLFVVVYNMLMTYQFFLLAVDFFERLFTAKSQLSILSSNAFT
jgi:hypothetical protein